MSEVRLPDAELEELERAVAHALETQDVSALDVLGYGEVSCVLGSRSGGRALACKRLPPFPDADAFATYQRCFAEYLSKLEQKGVRPVESTLQTVTLADGTRSAWCVQPRLDAAGLLSKHFARCSPDEAQALFESVAQAVLACAGPELGLDAQLSNWILDSGQLRYLDVTTPMLRTASGDERLPLAVFLASLPWALRPLVRRFMLRDILDKYYQPRGVLLDLLGNLHKEKLSHLLPQLIAHANTLVSPAIGEAEVKRYYDADASSWALLQRLRRADRWWQTRVRGRVYPFLLPGRIER